MAENEDLKSKIHMVEQALLSFAELKDEMTDQIKTMTEELNNERA